MLFDAQNAGNYISELLDFTYFWKGHAPRPPPRGKGPCGPFIFHSRLLHPQLPLITKVIETPANVSNMDNQLKTPWLESSRSAMLYD